MPSFRLFHYDGQQDNWNQKQMREKGAGKKHVIMLVHGFGCRRNCGVIRGSFRMVCVSSGCHQAVAVIIYGRTREGSQREKYLRKNYFSISIRFRCVWRIWRIGAEHLCVWTALFFYDLPNGTHVFWKSCARGLSLMRLVT